MKSAASKSNICYLGTVVPLFLSICACWGFNQSVHDCSMNDHLVIEPSRIYRQIEGMESKIACVITCLRDQLCSGVNYENKTKSCNHYNGYILFRHGLKGNYAMHFGKYLGVSLVPLEPPYELDKAKYACGLLRAKLSTHMNLLTAALYGYSTCTCGWTSIGPRSIQSSSDKSCPYSVGGNVATCAMPEHAYCTL